MSYESNLLSVALTGQLQKRVPITTGYFGGRRRLSEWWSSSLAGWCAKGLRFNGGILQELIPVLIFS
jgi:hypothetical protein